ncbi:MAG: 2-hydroxyacyl-CoA dehydratase family protein, partial [Clostridia bacterium]|nr:2-hydroxyacyl-CoA dehydratase family protein [Clostridia bacterium]
MLSDLHQAYHRWPAQSDAVKRWQEQGKKVFGYMCNHIPEELLYAGGILPVKFLGDSVPVVEANQYQSVFMCYYGRSLLEMGLQGAYRNLDGVVSAYGCEGGCNLFQVLVETVPVAYSQFISIPHNAKNALALKFFTQELLVMKRSLEEYLGREITAAELRKAIEVYNENRQLLRQVYDVRGLQNRPRLTGVEVAEIMNWVMEVAKEEANVHLKSLL